MQSIVNSVSECVDNFAPLRVCSGKDPYTKRNKLFQTWVEKPSKSNHDEYKSFRNKVCFKIREAKKQDNIRKLGINPTARAKFWNLKTQKNNDQQPYELPDLEKLKKLSVTIGTTLSSRLPQTVYLSGILIVTKLCLWNPLESSKLQVSSKH